MTNNKDTQQLVLKDISKTPMLPVITDGPLAGCFLANNIDVQIPLPNIPTIVANNWVLDGDTTFSTIKSIWIAVDTTWVLARKKETYITLTEAYYDIAALCGLSAVGLKNGLKRAISTNLRNDAFIEMTTLYHNGSGFDNGDHPLVLVVRRLGSSDKPILSVVGDQTD